MAIGKVLILIGVICIAAGLPAANYLSWGISPGIFIFPKEIQMSISLGYPVFWSAW